MKSFILSICLFVLSASTYGQDLPQDSIIKKPNANKCMVYFTRTSSEAMLVSFRFYDGAKPLGSLKAKKFIAYECNPGKHIFIGKSENTDYVEADLQEGKVYVIDANANMGILYARVKLKPLNKSDKKFEKQKETILKLLAKNKGQFVHEDSLKNLDKTNSNTDENWAGDTPSEDVEKFNKNKEKGKKYTQLTPEMCIDCEK